MTDQQKIRLLFIDDEDGLREVAEMYFGSQPDFEITTAENGRVGIEHINRAKFDAIITDIDMPEVDGIEVMFGARKSDLNCDTEIFILSAKIDQNVIKKATRLRIFNHFHKPYLMEDLAREVRKKTRLPHRALPYDPKIQQAFSGGAVDIVGHYFDEKAQIGNISVRNDLVKMKFVTCLLPIYGKTMVGSLSLSADRNFLMELLTHLFKERTEYPHDRYLADLLREMMNQMGGKIQRQLNALGLDFKLSIPQVVIDGGLLGTLPTKNPTVSIPISIRDVGCTFEYSLDDIAPTLIQETGQKPVEDGEIEFL